MYTELYHNFLTHHNAPGPQGPPQRQLAYHLDEAIHGYAEPSGITGQYRFYRHHTHEKPVLAEAAALVMYPSAPRD